MSEPADIDRPPEFSVPVRAEDAPHGGKTLRLVADADARRAVAERLDLVALDTLEGEVLLKPIAGGPMLMARGTVRARFTQRCVVTLDPVEGALEERFEVEFGPPEPDSLEETEREFTLDEPDPPEPIRDGRLDLGELLVQQVALALDPFPRKPGVDLERALADAPNGRAEAVEQDAPTGPFAALAKLKRGEG